MVMMSWSHHKCPGRYNTQIFNSNQAVVHRQDLHGLVVKKDSFKNRSQPFNVPKLEYLSRSRFVKNSKTSKFLKYYFINVDTFYEQLDKIMEEPTKL